MKINENEITPERLFEDRRKFLKLGAASVVASSTLMELMAKESLPTPNLTYKKDINANNLKLNSFEQITSYNNFYEFTTSKKDVKYMAHTLKPNPWAIEIDGLVEK
ncbi:MAG: mononuclear molybdenum enzyme YedY, partial [Arcobacter sp.]